MDCLRDLKCLLRSLAAGMGYSARPLSELISGERDSRFCRLAAEEPCFLTEPKTALLQAGESLLREEEDKELYRGFVQGLGDSDVSSQLEHIELYSSLLEKNLKKAEEAREKKSRLCVSLGLFGAVLFCLVLW